MDMKKTLEIHLMCFLIVFFWSWLFLPLGIVIAIPARKIKEYQQKKMIAKSSSEEMDPNWEPKWVYWFEAFFLYPYNRIGEIMLNL